MGFQFSRSSALAFGSLFLFMGLLVVTFQNCSGSANNPVSFISDGEAYPNGKLPSEISLEAYPPTPAHGEFVYLQPTFYETARAAHDWAAYKYEWLHDGQLLPDQTGVKLEIKSFSDADEGDYQLLVTDSHRTVPSKQFQLTNSDLARVLPITIAIAASPAKQIVGGSISLQLQKDVTKDWAYFTYEWLREGDVVSTDATYKIDSLQETHTGRYSLRLSDKATPPNVVNSESLMLAPVDPRKQLPEEAQLVVNSKAIKAGDNVTINVVFPKDPHLDSASIVGRLEDYYRLQWTCPSTSKVNCAAVTGRTLALNSISLLEVGRYNLTLTLNSDTTQSLAAAAVELPVGENAPAALPTATPTRTPTPTVTPTATPTPTTAPPPVTCPAGYVAVSPISPYSTQPFCVAQYEAKNNGGGQAVSQASGTPWVNISRDAARTACAAIGTGYGLITNAEWQTVARTIEVQSANWSGGSVGVGAITRGNSSTNQACAVTGSNDYGIDGLGGCTSSGNIALKRTHSLPYGGKIYDFAGNVYEWVYDNNSTNFGANSYMSLVTTSSHTTSGTVGSVTGVAKVLFGPEGDYTQLNGGEYGSLGSANLNSNAGAIYRGGAWSGGSTGGSGPFGVALNYFGFNYIETIGFRCVYRPYSCDAGTVPIGTACPGGGIYAGTFDGGKYMIMPSGCSDIPAGSISGGSGPSAYALNDFTPSSCSGTDSLRKTWNNGSANYYDIPGVETFTASSQKSSSSYRGSVNQAAVVAETASGNGGYHAAARYCDRLSYGDYTDWYLPSKSELAYIYCKAQPVGTHDTSHPAEDANCANYGGKTSELTGFEGAGYWTSTEYNNSMAWLEVFNNGYQIYAPKSQSGYQLRCVRRY